MRALLARQLISSFDFSFFLFVFRLKNISMSNDEAIIKE